MTDKVQEIMALVDRYIRIPTAERRAIIESRLREVVAPPVPEPTQRDAERYRWLRACYSTPNGERWDKLDRAMSVGGDALDAAIDQAIATAPPEATHTQPASEPVAQWNTEQGQRCPHCDGTGDVHSIDGQWRGRCYCPEGQASPSAQPAAKQAEPVARDWVASLKIDMEASAWDGVIQLEDALKNIDDALVLLRSEPEPTPEPGERERFEAQWYDFYHAGSIKADTDGTYWPKEVQCSWEAWQARASLPPAPTKETP